jgi:large subunit ribosomal protein L13
MKTKSAKVGEVTRRWFIVDVKDQVLGRAATKIAMVLRGKNKAEYTPHIDTGDFVVVINADKVKLTGTKEEKKLYRHHTMWVGAGGVVTYTAAEVRARDPERLVTQAVAGMLPKGILGRQLVKKLKVYAGGEHPHAAQKPEPLALASR